MWIRFVVSWKKFDGRGQQLGIFLIKDSLEKHWEPSTGKEINQVLPQISLKEAENSEWISNRRRSIWVSPKITDTNEEDRILLAVTDQLKLWYGV